MINIVTISSNVIVSRGIEYALKECKISFNYNYVDSLSDLYISNIEEKINILIVCPSNIKNFFINDFVNEIDRKIIQKILVVGNPENEILVSELLAFGVDGFITDECEWYEFKDAVNSILKDKKIFCNKVLDFMINRKSYLQNDSDCDSTSLSKRELEIVKHLAKGASNKEVAELFHISPHTVHTHRKNIMKKLNTHTISELTITCLNIGII